MSTIPARLVTRNDQILVDGRLVQVTGADEMRRLGDERRSFARTYELAWQDVETWQIDGRVFPAGFEFEFVKSAAQALETAS